MFDFLQHATRSLNGISCWTRCTEWQNGPCAAAWICSRSSWTRAFASEQASLSLRRSAARLSSSGSARCAGSSFELVLRLVSGMRCSACSCELRRNMPTWLLPKPAPPAERALIWVSAFGDATPEGSVMTAAVTDRQSMQAGLALALSEALSFNPRAPLVKTLTLQAMEQLIVPPGRMPIERFSTPAPRFVVNTTVVPLNQMEPRVDSEGTPIAVALDVEVWRFPANHVRRFSALSSKTSCVWQLETSAQGEKLWSTRLPVNARLQGGNVSTALEEAVTNALAAHGAVDKFSTSTGYGRIRNGPLSNDAYGAACTAFLLIAVVASCSVHESGIAVAVVCRQRTLCPRFTTDG